MPHSIRYRLPRGLGAALVVFLLAASAAASLIWRLNQGHVQDAHVRTIRVAHLHAGALVQSINRALSATYALATLVRQGDGTIRDFDATASGMLPFYPGAASLQLAPRGVVQSIVPPAGNEKAIGHDLLKDPTRTKAAFAARDTGKLTLDGPFNLLQGGLGAIGRLPVFLDDAKGNPSFWGFTSVLIRFPEVLEAAEFPILQKQGFAYELWRLDPDTKQKLIIAASSSAPLIEPVEEALNLPNATWTLSVAPIEGWIDFQRLSREATLGLLFSLLLAYIAKLLVELRKHTQELESLVAQRTAEVQASEERFRCLTEMSSDFYWESDVEHRLIMRGSANKKISMVSAFQRGTQIGERRWEIPYLSPDEAGWQAHRATLDAHLPFRNFELSRLGADGTERHISISGDPVFDAGAFKGYRGVGTDITERKKAETTRDQFAAIVENSNDAIFSRALDGTILSWNPGAEKMLGYTATEAIGKPATFNLPPDLQPQLAQNNERILRGETIAARESKRLTKDGRVIAVLISHSPVRDSAGKVIGASVFLNDITEYKRAQDALRVAEEQFRGLVEQSIAGIYIIQDGKLTYVNPRFAEIFGYASVDELIDRDALSVVAENERATVAENIRQWLKGGTRSISYNTTALRKDSSTIDVGVHGSRAKYRGQPAIIGMLQDISEKKRADEEIKRYVAQLETAFMSTVEVATTLSEMRDPYTAGHERRVGKIAAAIGAELGFDDRRIEGLRVSGNLHDIGKITIPAEILSKPGKLSQFEYQLIQQHPQSSYDVLKNLEFPWPVALVALQHHERMDGSGYPQGLKGDAILFEARIMAVADVVEAMSSHRPYRPGLGIDKALAEIERGRGTAYDADVADACLRLFRENRYQLPA